MLTHRNAGRGRPVFVAIKFVIPAKAGISRYQTVWQCIALKRFPLSREGRGVGNNGGGVKIMGVWVTFPLIHLDQQLTGVFAAVQHLQRGRGSSKPLRMCSRAVISPLSSQALRRATASG